ncbi:hypothetical protein IFM12275_53380 [Nocardia sputorum]|nr:hypothetical protein IFM12275_53380 [Nocardia sputorum]
MYTVANAAGAAVAGAAVATMAAIAVRGTVNSAVVEFIDTSTISGKQSCLSCSSVPGSARQRRGEGSRAYRRVMALGRWLRHSVQSRHSRKSAAHTASRQDAPVIILTDTPGTCATPASRAEPVGGPA